MRRTPVVGIGSHGGRGLFTLGVCAGFAWEELGEDALPYRHRIEVIWDGAIYRADYDSVFEEVTKYNERSWTSATREDYRRVVDFILDGDVVRRVRDATRLPWEWRREKFRAENRVSGRSVRVCEARRGRAAGRRVAVQQLST